MPRTIAAGMGMDVDETWRQHVAAGVDDAVGRNRAGLGRGKQCDAIAANAHHGIFDHRLVRLRCQRRRSAQDVERFWRRPGLTKLSFLGSLSASLGSVLARAT